MKKNIYEKALYLYSKGNIEKAIEICEKEISRDLKNFNIINLKGLLLYLKGDLEDSIALWSINKDYNNDKIAISYLSDSNKDFKRKELYEHAEELMYNLEIDEAIKILNTCRESDFNSINVNTALAKCYLKKGEYESVKTYLEEVFKIDKYNIIARQINNELKGVFKCNNREVIFSKIIIGLAFSILIAVIVFIGKKKIFDIDLETQSIQQSLNDLEEYKQIEENKEINENLNNTNPIDTVDITSKFLNDDEIREIYIKATEYFEEGNYGETKEILAQAVNYLNGNHLDDDIIFLLGSVCYEMKDSNEAIENFERYIMEYSDGSYIVESYYRVALLYKDIDIAISKNYANEILINYPDSIYNNSYIEEILNS